MCALNLVMFDSVGTACGHCGGGLLVRVLLGLQRLRKELEDGVETSPGRQLMTLGA